MQKYKSLDLKLKHKKHDLYTWLLILCDKKKRKRKANIYGHQNGSLLEQYIHGKIGTQRVQYHFA